MKSTDSFDKCIEYLHQNLEILDQLSCSLTEARSGSPRVDPPDTGAGADISDARVPTELSGT